MEINTRIASISGFNDFCSCLMNGKSFLWCNGHLYADFDCLVGLKYAYNFIDQKALAETEKAIKDNIYMFDTEETSQFYYPNDNMFSNSNAEKNIKGYVVKLKEKYRYKYTDNEKKEEVYENSI